MFTKFEEIFAELANRGAKKRMIAAWAVDGHTIAAASKAVDLGIVDATLVGDEDMIQSPGDGRHPHEGSLQYGQVHACHPQ